ncbi:OmpW family outer membrane protein [Aquabacterium sp.]|uniref:OmpW/AlkL family protein n=1 Tax=Aquabacterium sp. TaxID=1872578 RepID=UPI002488257A|nr:OmpW family outer membrane protein [Aquabacterium sp.]MDI1348679.1 outer membrane beta-barrel protein [Aquabacterium sp.]
MTKTSALTRVAAAGLALSALSAPLMAQTAEGPWLVRARAVHLSPENGGNVNGLAINDKSLPEVDITYFITRNIAAELILTYPQKQDVTLNGNDIGSLKHLPPTLTVQYHFNPEGTVRPYAGAGINYTRFSSVKILDGAGKLDKSSFGFAFGAGLDIKLADRWFLNVDVKKVKISTDVTASGNKLGTFKVDPVLFGVGIGYRF